MMTTCASRMAYMASCSGHPNPTSTAKTGQVK